MWRARPYGKNWPALWHRRRFGRRINEFREQCRKPPRLDGGPDAGHQREVVIKVVNRREARPQDLVALLQMAEVGARVVAARVAPALGIDRPRIGLETA